MAERADKKEFQEAQAILNYNGEETDVQEESVLLEKKSRTTYENLLFSKRLGNIPQRTTILICNEWLSCLSNQYLR